METRALLAAVSLNPVADGTVTDSNRDGVFDSISNTTSITDRNFDFNPSPRYEERGVFEFDLRALAGGTISTDVSFQINVSSYTTSGGVNPQANVYLYIGDGTLSAGDGTANGSLATSFTVNDTGNKTITLTAAQVQPFVGSYLGIRIVNPDVDGQWFGLRSSESTDGPKLNFEADVPSSLSVSLSTDSVLENAGSSAVVGTVTRTGDLSQSLQVQLSSSDPSEATVPASVVIPANEASANFAVQVVDDAIIDGSQTVSIQVQGLGNVDATGTIALDSTFGTAGQKTFSTLRDSARMARQSDGKLIVVGRSTSSTQSWTVSRLLPNGTLDTTFGTGGQTTTTAVGGSYTCMPNRVLVQGDGKILVAGDRWSSYGTPVVARYLPDGTLDASFGTGGIDAITATEGYVSDAALQSDGKILLTISYSGSGVTFRVVRLNGNGTLDTSFGNNGTGIANYSTLPGTAGAILVRPDNSFYLVGDNRVVRCLASGAFDLTFGMNGVATLAPNGSVIRLSCVAEQPDGAIVVGGYAFPEGTEGVITNTDTFLTRLMPNGAPDPTFGQNGRVLIDLAPGAGWSDNVSSLFAQPNGKLLTVGNGWIAENDSWNVIARWNPDGTLDQTFDGDGLIRADYSPSSTGSIGPSAVLQPDGKLAVTTGWYPNIAVRRFNTSTTAPLTGYAAWASLEVRDVEQGNTAPDLRTQTFVVPENSSVNATVATVVSTDTETPQSLEYAITGGNTGGTFTIDPATGAIKVANATLLDFEHPTAFHLTVEVHDHGSPDLIDSGIVHLTLSDVNEVPSISPQTFTLAENVPNGTIVGTVAASDVDAGQSLTYAITGGNTNGAFAINSATGQITVANTSVINFETNPTFSLTVQVIDNGSPNLSASATITINLTDVNEVPNLQLSPTVLFLDENTSTTGGLNVATITILDDALGSETVSLTGTDASIFEVVGENLRIKSGTVLDFEVQDNYTVTVNINDPTVGGNPDANQSLTLFLNDVNDVPVALASSVTTEEDTAKTFAVSDFSFSDADGNGLASITIDTLSLASGDVLKLSGVDVAAGQTITAANIPNLVYTPAANANGSARSSFTFRVNDADNGIIAAMMTINVTAVNDAPVITLQALAIAENTSNGAIIGTVTVSDPDVEQTLSYGIVGGNENNAFAINAATGQLTVNNPAALNFEAVTSIPVEVRVTDDGNPALSDTVTISIAITDVNEAPSIALQNVTSSLPENTSTTNRVKVADIIVSDDALGNNALSLSGADASSFEIFNGGLYLKAGTNLDFESKTSYAVTVEVDDPTVGSTPDATAAFSLVITNVNEGPTVSGLPANQAVNDNATIAPFAAVTVTDPDTQNLFVRVTILNGIARGDFMPASTSGWTRKTTGNNIIYERFFSPQANIGGVAQAALRTFVFQPRSNAIKPNTTELADISVFVNDGVANTTATTRLTTTSVNNIPAVSGASSTVTVNDNATVNPFATLTVTDADMQEMLISVTILNGVVRGDFTPASTAGWAVRQVIGNNITYKRYFPPQTNVGVAAQAAFRALVFQPRTNAIKPGTTEATDFQVTVSDGVAAAIANNGTRVTTTSVNDAPLISGAVANQTMNDDQTKAVFSTLTVTDPDTQNQFVRMTITGGTTKGDFTAASTTGWTRKTSNGNILYERFFNAAANNGSIVQAAIRALVFQPRTNVPIGTAETTSFTIFINDGMANATNSDTSVITNGVAPRVAAPSVTTSPLVDDQDIKTIVIPSIRRSVSNPLARLIKKAP